MPDGISQIKNNMKRLLVFIAFMMMMQSCSVFRGSEKVGCPGNGKNIGAEKIASGDPAAIKAAKKARKFKS